MPIVSASNGIRPEIRALAVIQLNKPVTPKQINDCVGTGDYAAKYISFLNTRYGFTIEAQKDGRTVVSYVCIAEPANVTDLRSTKPKETKLDRMVKKAKAEVRDYVKAKSEGKEYSFVAEAAKRKAALPKTTEEIKAKNLATMQKVTAKAKKVKQKSKRFDFVEKELGSTGEIATSFTVDGDWDSMQGVDVKSLII